MFHGPGHPRAPTWPSPVQSALLCQPKNGSCQLVSLLKISGTDVETKSCLLRSCRKRQCQRGRKISDALFNGGDHLSSGCLSSSQKKNKIISGVVYFALSRLWRLPPRPCLQTQSVEQVRVFVDVVFFGAPGAPGAHISQCSAEMFIFFHLENPYWAPTVVLAEGRKNNNLELYFFFLQFTD